MGRRKEDEKTKSEECIDMSWKKREKAKRLKESFNKIMNKNLKKKLGSTSSKVVDVTAQPENEPLIVKKIPYSRMNEFWNYCSRK